jgi:hypothetical protein
MKHIYDNKIKVIKYIPETPLESIESLEEFFIADMNGRKFKEGELIPYLRKHFKICKKEIRTMEKNK